VDRCFGTSQIDHLGTSANQTSYYFPDRIRLVQTSGNPYNDDLTDTFYFGFLNIQWMFESLTFGSGNARYYVLQRYLESIDIANDSYVETSHFLFNYYNGGTIGDPFPITARSQVAEWPGGSHPGSNYYPLVFFREMQLFTNMTTGGSALLRGQFVFDGFRIYWR
jgi:hypothetical protein